MSDEHTIEAFINPLLFTEAEERPPFEPQELKAESVLAYIANDTNVVTLAEMKKNYNRIAERATKLWAVPVEPAIMMKIVFPLKHAVGYYTLGNFLESIAICGFVAEMAAIFKFIIYDVSVIDRPVQKKEDELENLEEIEWMRQSQRTDKLLELGLIDTPLKAKFDNVSRKRNEYLHSFTKENTDAADTAVEVFNDTLDILLAVTKLGIGAPGRAVLDPKIFAYLRKKGKL